MDIHRRYIIDKNSITIEEAVKYGVFITSSFVGMKSLFDKVFNDLRDKSK